MFHDTRAFRIIKFPYHKVFNVDFRDFCGKYINNITKNERKIPEWRTFEYVN